MQRVFFTLIELLVVIAIIAILAAMLMSSLSAAQQRGWAAGCQNNLRQLAVGYLSYADEFSYTPPVWSSNRWMNSIARFVENGDVKTENSIFRCPVDRRDGVETSYGINQTYPRDPECRRREDLLWYGLSFSKIKNPSGFIILADACKYYIGKDVEGRGSTVMMDGEMVVSGGIYSNLALRHQMNFNAAFADGHTEYLPYNSTLNTAYWDYNNDRDEDF